MPKSDPFGVAGPFFAALLACLTMSFALPTPGLANDDDQTITVNGTDRDYMVHMPQNLAPDTKVPLVIVMHGGGGGVDSIVLSSAMSDKADKEGFIVIYPAGTGRMGSGRMLTWNAGGCCAYAMSSGANDIAFLGALIDQAEKTMPVDPKRVYVAGMSNGAMMSERVGGALANKIAALGIVSGGMFQDQPVPSEPVSVIMFHGAVDNIVPFAGGMSGKGFVARSMSAPFLPTMTAYDFWRDKDGCQGDPKETDAGNVVTFTSGPCRNGTEVVLYKLMNGGHAWPGGVKGGFMGAGGDQPTNDISATDLMWAFFAAHPKM